MSNSLDNCIKRKKGAVIIDRNSKGRGGIINRHCLVVYLNLVLYTIFCGGIQVLVSVLVTLLSLISTFRNTSWFHLDV